MLPQITNSSDSTAAMIGRSTKNWAMFFMVWESVLRTLVLVGGGGCRRRDGQGDMLVVMDQGRPCRIGVDECLVAIGEAVLHRHLLRVDLDAGAHVLQAVDDHHV